MTMAEGCGVPAASDPRILKAAGPSILRLGFDPARVATLRPEQVKDIAYHLARLLTGEGSAASEWEHFGIKVDLRPWEPPIG